MDKEIAKIEREKEKKSLYRENGGYLSQYIREEKKGGGKKKEGKER